MSKNAHRHARSFAAGAYAAAKEIKAQVGALLPDSQRQQFAALVDNLCRERFPMPPPSRKVRP